MKLLFLFLIPALAFGDCTPTPTPCTPTPSPTIYPSKLSAIWWNTGEDKVTKDELRNLPTTPITLFAAKNEVTSFNLVLEAKTQAVSGVSVVFNLLTGPNGSKIETTQTDPSNMVGRPIEMFYVRYLQIKGLSLLSYQLYDERHIPKLMRRPYSGPGYGNGTWNDRPNHDKSYPDIAIPMELVRTFDIVAGTNQSIWADIYIPKTAQTGAYQGNVTIKEAGQVTKNVPITLDVRNFMLPDMPTAKSMLYISYPNINQRYLGTPYPQTDIEEAKSIAIQDKFFQLAHRHRISLIDDNDGKAPWTVSAPRPAWQKRLDGTLFTSTHGYDGPGVGQGNNVFSIGTYGKLTPTTRDGMRTLADAWVTWFDANSPQTEYFIYLIDESTDYAQINTWAQWINRNPALGSRLQSFATANFVKTSTLAPALDIAGTWTGNTLGVPATYEAAKPYYSQPNRALYYYNGHRPESGSFSTEDEGVALRLNPWIQWKKGIKRWFSYEATYWNDYQSNRGQTNVFQTAQVFGFPPTFDNIKGMTSYGYTNGDGVLFYPGTDKVFPAESYNVDMPIASLRLKHWRRGIQDVDYLALANAKDPVKVKAIVDRMIPKVLWEYGVNDPSDPTWVQTDISWSTDPLLWEAARKELAEIIEK